MRGKIALFTLAVLLSLSFISISSIAAQENELLQVSWNTRTDYNSMDRVYNQSAIAFGPSPTITVSFLNGTEIPNDGSGVIPLETPVNISAIIPANVLVGDRIKFIGVYISSSKMYIHLTYDKNGGFSVSSGEYGGASIELFNLNENDSALISTKNGTVVSFIGEFTASLIASTFYFSISVVDVNGGTYSPGYSKWFSGEFYQIYVIGEIVYVTLNVTKPDGTPLQNIITRGEEVWLHVTAGRDLASVQVRISTGRWPTVNNSMWPEYIFFIYNSSGVWIEEGYCGYGASVIPVFYGNHTYFTPAGNDTSNKRDIIFKGTFTSEFNQTSQCDILIYATAEGNAYATTPPDFDKHLYVEKGVITTNYIDSTSGKPVYGVNQGSEFNITVSIKLPQDILDTVKGFQIKLNCFRDDKLHQTYNISEIRFRYFLWNDSYYSYGTYTVRLYNWTEIEYSEYYDVVEDIEWAVASDYNIIIVYFRLSLSDSNRDGTYCSNIDLYNTTDFSQQIGVFKEYKPDSALVIGEDRTRRIGIWSFEVAPDGALDLDGDLKTTSDRYYIRSVYSTTDVWGYNWTYMELSINWVRNNITLTNIKINAGLMKTFNEYNWSNNFYWYHTDWTPVNLTELMRINYTIYSKWGYEPIKWFTHNITINDYLGKYWWLSQNRWEYSWFFLSVSENYIYQTPELSDNIAFKADYAGLLLFNDSDGDGVPRLGYSQGSLDIGEVTHYFIIENVDELSFIRPFNETSPLGSSNVSINTPITFTVTLRGVSGTLYPSNIGNLLYSPYAFYHNPFLTIDETDFEKTLESASIDEMSFTGHFQITPSSQENQPETATLKIDQYIGNWSLTHFNNSVLSSRSLAICYNAHLSTSSMQTMFKAGESPVAPNDNTTANDFKFESENAKLAEIKMGGLNYTWGRNGQVYNASSSTTPLYAFKSMYTTETNDTLTSFEITDSMYFLTTAFKNWGGYSIDNDPSFSIFPFFEGEEGGGLIEEIGQSTFIIVISVVTIAVISIALFLLRRHRRLI
ncbi:MAG: hypothetical protein OdinLCB4_002785 [Candidatus Odinarchaeum yellowstonii]|uniref:Uncharacterized protein n=1 Tax=Odinarchaeota yellowstonii (strain LCB_4) TaxID=1841599 RepID=A0AAF0D375_ODILC|nr:MAG: hypothetical protein OdinLCB4_002785 [Candidatus Odinarchaeum yellowstonii]